MSKKIIEYLYPEVSNLYGDPFNVKFLAKCIEENGLEAEVVKDELNAEPFFVKNLPDAVYLGPMTEHAQELVIARLKPYVARLRELVEAKVVFLITGNAFEIFEKAIECEDGTKIECLGMYEGIARRKMFNRYNSLFLGEFEGIRIVGNKSQFSHSFEGDDKHAFIKVLRGDGSAPGNPYEGIKDVNFMATYLLGPLLVLNPLFTKNILEKMGIENARLVHEAEAVKAYEIRLKEFEDEKTELA